MNSSYVSIIILYNNEEFSFLYKEDLGTVIYVDNTPARKLDVIGSCVYIPLMHNKGIAEAQNVGILKAKKLGYKYVFFFDQDSDFDRSYLEKMIYKYVSFKKKNPNLAFLGPRIINKSTGKFYKSEIDDNSVEFVETDIIISSGSLIELATLDKIGLMESSLFIDYVDFEICWRAKSKGFVNGITKSVVLQHKVGQVDKHFLGFPIIISSPFRYFYQYRNFFVLFRRSYVPFKWKMKMLVRKVVELIYVPVYLKSSTVLVNMLKGIMQSFYYKKQL